MQKPQIIITKDFSSDDIKTGEKLANEYRDELTPIVETFIKDCAHHGYKLDNIISSAQKLARFWELSQQREAVLFIAILSCVPSLLEGTFIVELISWMVEWGATGFPCLTLSPEQSAAFAMTDLSDQQLDDFQLPWNTYLMKLPGKSFSTDDGTVDFCMVHRHTKQFTPRHEGTLSIFAFCNFHEYWVQRRSVQYIHNEAFELTQADILPVTSQENRLMRLLNRAIIVSAYSATHGHMQKRTSTKKKKQSRRKRPQKKQKPRHLIAQEQYIIGTPVTIQAQSFVRSLILKGSAEKTKMSWWVRGHYKNQPYGPQNALRKNIFIEPYQKGLSTSPVLIREHRFPTQKRDNP